MTRRPLLVLDAGIFNAGAPFLVPRLTERPVLVRRLIEEAIDLAPSAVAGVVISGSAASVFDESIPWMRPLIDWVGEATAKQVPTLGCCFGHQVLGAVAGAPVVLREVAEVGYLPVDLDPSDPLLGALGPRIVPFVSHADEVLPAPGIEVLGRSAACAVHALRLPGRPAWGVQFHLEYPREEQERVLTYRAAKHPELGLDPQLAARAPDLEPLAESLFRRFQALVDVWEGATPG